MVHILADLATSEIALLRSRLSLDSRDITQGGEEADHIAQDAAEFGQHLMHHIGVPIYLIMYFILIAVTAIFQVPIIDYREAVIANESDTMTNSSRPGIQHSTMT